MWNIIGHYNYFNIRDKRYWVTKGLGEREGNLKKLREKKTII